MYLCNLTFYVFIYIKILLYIIMDTLQIILLLFSVLIFGLFTIQYYQPRKTIEGMDNQCPSDDSCPNGCNVPTKITTLCDDTLYTEPDGRCYKLCPYECTDPMSQCAFDECCDGCGKKKIYVDCATGNMINDGPDLNNINQETNHSTSPINTGKNSSNIDLQGSLVDDETTTPPLDKPSLVKSCAPNVEYHNYYTISIEGAFPPGKHIVDKNAVSIESQKGAPNPYRPGGDISNALDNQTRTMESSLAQKEDPDTVMNYGVFGSPKSSMPPPATTASTNYVQPLTTATGMFNEKTTQPYNSVYSVDF